MQKCVLRQMRAAKAQISLRIRAVWSGPSLSAKGIIRYKKVNGEQMHKWDFAHVQNDVNPHNIATARRHYFGFTRPDWYMQKQIIAQRFQRMTNCMHNAMYRVKMSGNFCCLTLQLAWKRARATRNYHTFYNYCLKLSTLSVSGPLFPYIVGQSFSLPYL